MAYTIKPRPEVYCFKMNFKNVAIVHRGVYNIDNTRRVKEAIHIRLHPNNSNRNI